MTRPVRGVLARIWDRQGYAAGAGFLVGPRHVLTCAHVAAAVLGADDADPAVPEDSVLLDFPLAGGRPAKIEASVVRWLPVGPDGAGDIAGLLLSQDPPPEVEPAPLVTVAEPYGLGFRTFGFPDGRPGGDWAGGVLADVQANAWLQIEHERQTGRRVQPGYSGAPVWVEDVQGIVGMVVAADRRPEDRVAYIIPTGVLVAAWPEVLGERAIAPSPYRGLAAFAEPDAELFFGRGEVVDRLARAVGDRPLVVVVGPSGSGKSSVVQAGLLPRLHATGEWTTAVFRPRKEPFEELAAVLLRLLEPGTSELDLLTGTPRMAQLLREGRIEPVVRQIAATAPGGRLLLVADQFEELYTHNAGSTVPAEFVAQLLRVAAPGDGHDPAVRVLLTMRADFLNQALDDRAFAQALTGAIEPVGPMPPTGLRAAIEEPARLRQAAFEPGLVDRILSDVGDRPGRLPLLEFTLSLLWERQRLQRITHAAYDEIGGVEGALSHHAEQVYARCTEPERTQVRQVLLQLVSPGEATEDFRRLATRDEFRAADRPVVRHLADERLVVTGAGPTGDETVEIVHEALIRGWGRLREWVSVDRTFRLWQERVRDQIRVWHTYQRDQGILLRGPLLAEAETWLRERGGEITAEEREFVELSRERQEREDVRYKNLYQEALSRQLVAQAELVRADRPNALTLSALLAADSLRRAPSFEADFALRRAMALLPSHTVRLPHDEDVQVALFTPDGARLITAGDDASASVWDVRTGRRLLRLRHDEGSWVRAVAVSPGGDLVVTGSENGGARLWSLENGDMLGEMMHDGWVGAVAFSPDGSLLATGCDDGIARVWDGGSLPKARLEHAGWVRSVSFSPDGSSLLTGSGDHTARLWRVGEWSEFGRLRHQGPVCTAVFSPERWFVATGSDDETAMLWSYERPIDTPTAVLRHEGAVSAVAFNRDGSLLGTASADGCARVWNTGETAELVKVRHPDAVRSLAFDPAGERLLTAGDDGTARVWAFDGTEVARMCHQQAVRAVAVSPDGRWGASASQDKDAALWSTTARPELRSIEARGAVKGLAVSVDDRLLASAAEDGELRLWLLADGSQVRLQTDARACALALSPDGGSLAAADAEGAVRIWSVPGGDLTASITADVQEPRALAFSPDGGLLAVGGDADWVDILQVSGGARSHKVHHGDSSGVVRFTADGAGLAVVGDDGTITRWRTADGASLGRREYAKEWLGAAALDRRITRLATVGRAGHVRILDLPAGEIRCEIDHESWVTAVEFSQDGDLLATIGDDTAARIWDTATGAERHRLPHPRRVTAAAFAHDRSILITGAEDGLIRFWPLRRDALIEQASTRLHRTLTREEWSRYLTDEPYPTGKI